MDLAYRTPEEEIAALRHELAAARAQLGTAAVEIAHLQAQLAALRRQQYGQSSERLDAEIAQLELRLEDLEENEAEHQAARPNPDSAGGQSRPRAKAVRRPLPDHLPRETVVHEPEMVCGCGDRSRLARLGEDTTEVLEKIPARLKVICHVRPRYACRVCEAVFQAPAPDLPIERGRPGPGLIAHVAVSKYCDGLPLFRQSVILAREGVEIDRVTLADWIGRAAWWLAPLAQLIGTTVMTQPVLHTDDTPIRTLAPGTGKTRLSRFWAELPKVPRAKHVEWQRRAMPWILDRTQEQNRRRRSTATRPTVKVSGRESIWQASTARCMPTLSPATTRCIDRHQDSLRGSSMPRVGRSCPRFRMRSMWNGSGGPCSTKTV